MKRLGIDIGGTFTDGVLVDDGSGEVRHEKSPSTPGEPLEGLLSVLAKLDVDARDVDVFVHGTTLVTNLVLQRTGCRVGLITTTGFRDVLEIQRSYRPEPLNLRWRKTAPLVPRHLRLEVSERIAATGEAILVPQREDVLEAGNTLVREGVEAIAVCFMNSFVNPAHERLVQSWLLEQWPTIPVCISFDVDPQIREFERVSTTTINAYAIPEVNTYLEKMQATLGRDVLMMHSGGGVLPATSVAARPVRLVQSGPAGGVIATEKLGEQLGRSNLITFDMGGTSTDVSVIVEGRLARAEETEITWGIPIRAESLEIRSIGAGGGSIASQDAGGALKVGPNSAGADPGPVAYGNGGTEPTVTDANLLLGLLNPKRFLGGSMSMAVEAADEAMTKLGAGFGVGSKEVALAIHKTVNATMAQLIREMTVNKGHDPRDFSLVSFGGAGGQHAHGVADFVGCTEVLFPRHAGAFSALGLARSALRTSEVMSILTPLEAMDRPTLERTFDRVGDRARENFGNETTSATTAERSLMIRYVGQTHEVMTDVLAADEMADIYERFQQTHQRLFGTRLDDPVEIVSAHVTVSFVEEASSNEGAADAAHETTTPAPSAKRWCGVFAGSVPVFDGDSFTGGEVVSGPALVEEADTSIVVPTASRLRFDGPSGCYILTLERRKGEVE